MAWLAWLLCEEEEEDENSGQLFVRLAFSNKFHSKLLHSCCCMWKKKKKNYPLKEGEKERKTRAKFFSASISLPCFIVNCQQQQQRGRSSVRLLRTLNRSIELSSQRRKKKPTTAKKRRRKLKLWHKNANLGPRQLPDCKLPLLYVDQDILGLNSLAFWIESRVFT